MTGTATYALLAVPFLGVAALVAVAAGAVAARRHGAGRRPVGVVSAVLAGAVLLVMTGVFNNVIVGLGIVAYDPALVSGARVGLFPVEDLAYSIGAALLLPSCWVLLDRPRAERPVRSERPSQPPRRPEETP
ncbi:hypothetical protein DEJ23_05855 [Curtobacterium sp. MCSS17_008]|uniref:lycopene cyclase domain-containing protein n=1 Tax=Curtobacterium sp. MCSS17_008 TaxID=2175647 RepID=UPI000DA9341C|nr:lycopene cyclase domain-containing protein [Curtobacterium sp. MCSS17_008]PZF57669.1 hypothetical protein DEJ23_05855 [Curtobacterium sp. MCSS17_008]